MDASKVCRDCAERKPQADFYADSTKLDGLSSYCRPCTCLRTKARKAQNANATRTYQRAYSEANRLKKQEYGRQYREANRERISTQQSEYRKSNTERIRARKRAYCEANREKVLEGKRAYSQGNPERVRETYRAWYAVNREQVLEYKRAWKAANRAEVRLGNQNRRARKRALTTVSFTAEQLSLKWAYHGGKCWICGVSADSTDHVKPLAKGGAHMLCNLRPICSLCNNRKNAQWPYSPPQRAAAA